jgi:hypothetical protein
VTVRTRSSAIGLGLHRIPSNDTSPACLFPYAPIGPCGDSGIDALRRIVYADARQRLFSCHCPAYCMSRGGHSAACRQHGRGHPGPCTQGERSESGIVEYLPISVHVASCVPFTGVSAASPCIRIAHNVRISLRPPCREACGLDKGRRQPRAVSMLASHGELRPLVFSPTCYPSWNDQRRLFQRGLSRCSGSALGQVNSIKTFGPQLVYGTLPPPLQR